MKSFISSFNLDFAGAFASAVCAVHCAIVPLAISIGAMTGAHWLHNHAFDWIFIGFGVVIAGFTLIKDYLKTHKDPTPVIIGITGLVLLIIGSFKHEGFFIVASLLGGIMVVSAHYINWKRSRHACKLAH
jgi:hypothetical protein